MLHRARVLAEQRRYGACPWQALVALCWRLSPRDEHEALELSVLKLLACEDTPAMHVNGHQLEMRLLLSRRRRANRRNLLGECFLFFSHSNIHTVGISKGK